MSVDPDSGPAPADALIRLQDQVDAMRAVLTRLLQDVVVAEGRLDNAKAAQLIAANEALVVSAIRSQADAEAAARALTELSTWAERDALTQLPNRILLLDRMETAIAQARRRDGSLALLFVDLNHFKRVNDTLGHRVGDDVLKEAARCLLASVREADTVSRHGGDEFLILLPDVADVTDALLVADKALAALAIPKQVAGYVLSVTASIGISLYPAHGQDATSLIDRADSAMYRAKKHGLGRSVYEPDADAASADEPSSESANEAADQSADAAATANPAINTSRRSIGPDELPSADAEHRSSEMLEANQNLLLAALTARDLLDASEAAQRRQNELMALVSHHLRKPLVPIRRAGSMLERVRPDQPLLAGARQIIDRQTRHMARLVDDLLDVGRARLGTLGVALVRLDLAGVIDAATRATRGERERRRQRLVAEVPAHPWPVSGDRVRLVQVVSNLLTHASRYTLDGGQIELSLARVADQIELTVRDNGIGIAGELLPRAFDPFVLDGHPRGFDGSGLGVALTVVRELVHGHGGTVTAASAGHGKGSQFVVSLPALTAVAVAG